VIWIVSAGIDKNAIERKARLQYIKEVSGDKYISWEKKRELLDGGFIEYYQCITKDGINGTCITAHNVIAMRLSILPCVVKSDFVVANTCKLPGDLDKRILQQLQNFNSSAQLYYAKQEQEEINGEEYDSNMICAIGTFGFKTSKSERMLFKKRKIGLIEAIQNSFDHVVI